MADDNPVSVNGFDVTLLKISPDVGFPTGAGDAQGKATICHEEATLPLGLVG